MAERIKNYHVQVAGAGPSGGLAFRIAAENTNTWESLQQRGGVAVLDRGASIGSGRLGNLRIRSNSPFSDFDVAGRGIFADTPETIRLRSKYGDTILPLTAIGGLLHELGQIAETDLEQSEKSDFIPDTAVAKAVIGQDGKFTTFDTQDRPIATSDSLVLATGATEKLENFLQPYAEKTILSHDFLELESNPDFVAQYGLTGEEGEVVVLGGAHSALSVGEKFLRDYQDSVGVGGITLIHRSPIRRFYPSIDAANQASYDFDNVADVCPQTDRVNRFQGVRGDAGDLLDRITNGSETKVTRVNGLSGESLQAKLQKAKVIIQATGYTVNEIPIFDARSGREERIGPQIISRRVAVNAQAQVLDNSGHIIPGLYGIGLGHGILPNPEVGGEPSAVNIPVDGFNVSVGYVAPKIIYDILNRREVTYV